MKRIFCLQAATTVFCHQCGEIGTPGWTHLQWEGACVPFDKRRPDSRVLFNPLFPRARDDLKPVETAAASAFKTLESFAQAWGASSSQPVLNSLQLLTDGWKF